MNTPADRVIQAFGGVRATARALGLNSSSVSRWRMPPEKRGLGGRVPSVHQYQILLLARQMGADLTAEDLIHAGGGGDVERNQPGRRRAVEHDGIDGGARRDRADA